MMEELDDQKSTRGVDEYKAIFSRRKWWILGPLFFGWLLVFRLGMGSAGYLHLGKRDPGRAAQSAEELRRAQRGSGPVRSASRP